MPANITSGFRKAGVFPFDHDAVKVIMLIIQVNVTMMTMVVVKIIQVHAPQTSLSTFWTLMWIFLNGDKGNEDPLGDDRGGSSLENDVDTVGVCEGIYIVIV